MPKNVKIAVAVAFVAANLQAATGIIAVVRGAPAHEALTHQFSSLLLLTSAIYMCHTLRRPNKVVLENLIKMRSFSVSSSNTSTLSTSTPTKLADFQTIRPGHFDKSFSSKQSHK